MRFSRSRYACSLCATILAFLGLTLAANAQTTTYTDMSSFLASIQSGYYLETFDGLTNSQVTLSSIASPLSFSSNGFDYTATAAGDFYTLGTGSDISLSTNFDGDSIIFDFTSGNVTAVGGNFFLTDFDGGVATGGLNLLLSDGTSVDLTDAIDTTFTGFTSAIPITSLTVTPTTDTFANPVYSTVNNLIVGTATTRVEATTPEPGTTALLVGMSATGLMVFHRRRKVRGAKAA